MRDIAPQHEEHWFELYGQVALSGQSKRFEYPAVQLHRWYEGYAYRIGGAEDRTVAVIFNDITERKQVEDTLRRSHEELRAHADELARFNRIAVDRELRMIELKQEVNDARRVAGLPPAYELNFSKETQNAGSEETPV